MYALSPDAFNENHRQMLETVAPQISNLFKRTADIGVGRRRPAQEKPDHTAEDILAGSLRDHSSMVGGTMTIMFIDITGLNRISHDFGLSVADEVIRQVVKNTRSHLRITDILFRHGSDELVALLHATELDYAQLLADRIRSSVRDEPIAMGNEQLYIDVDIACVPTSREGDSLPDLCVLRASEPKQSGAIPKHQVCIDAHRPCCTETASAV